MATEFLDIDRDIGVVQPEGGVKATPYFEDLLYNYLNEIGGEGTTLIQHITNVVGGSTEITTIIETITETIIQATEIVTQVKSLERETESAVLNSKLKSISLKLSAIETGFDVNWLTAMVKQLIIDTSPWVSVLATGMYTAKHRDWVEASNRAPIELPSNPLRDHIVRVAIGDTSTIEVSGGNNLKIKTKGGLQSSVSFNGEGNSFDFQWFGDYWRAA